MNSNFANLNFSNLYADLPQNFYEKINPTPVANPKLIKINHNLAKELGLNIKDLESQKGVDILSGNIIAHGSNPIALAYAGHQFEHFSPRLGDGRAVLLGQIQDNKGNYHDVQLKGSGQTSFSRRGDGRSAIGPVIREYIVSEAMHNLGIKTTRALACVTNGEFVMRETTRPGAILTRVASSHIRIGTFEYFAARKDKEAIKLLADYAINQHYKNCQKQKNPYLELLKEVIKSQASLVASWMSVGFIHGVLNTDNVAISGQTIDYGPCAFMDDYDPLRVFSFIDKNGRYAFGNQAQITVWNLSRLADTLLPLIDDDIEKSIDLAQIELEKLAHLFNDNWLKTMREKLGFLEAKDDDLKLIQSYLAMMQKYDSDYTLSFRYLSNELNYDSQNFALFKSKEFKDWKEKWKLRLKEEKNSVSQIAKNMNKINPLFIPRNHQIEKVIQDAQNNNFSKMEELIKVLQNPFKEQKDFKDYSNPPKPEEIVPNTFCGT